MLSTLTAAAAESEIYLTDYWIAAADGHAERVELVKFTTSAPAHFELDKWTYADCIFIYSPEVTWDGTGCTTADCMKKLEQCLPGNFVHQAYPFHDARGSGLKIELCNCTEINRHAVELVNLHEAGQGVHCLRIPALEQLDGWSQPQNMLAGGKVIERIPLHYVSAAEAKAYLQTVAKELKIAEGALVVTGGGEVVEFKAAKTDPPAPKLLAGDMLSACTRYAWFLRHYGQLSALEDKKFRELYDFDKSHFKACDGACDACGYGPPVPLEQLKDIAPPQKALQAPVDVEALWTWLEALNVQLGNEPGLSVYSLEDGEVLLGRLPKPQFADVAGVSWEQFLKLLTSDLPDLPDGVTALDESTVNRLWVWTRDELLARTSLSDCAGCGGNASGQMCAYLKQCGRPSSGDDPACGDRIGKRYRREAFLLKYGVEWHQWCAGLLTFGLPVEPPPLRSSSESMLAWDWFKNTLKRALKVSDDFFVKYPPEANLFAPQGMIFGVLPAERFDCIYGTGSWDQLAKLLQASRKNYRADPDLADAAASNAALKKGTMRLKVPGLARALNNEAVPMMQLVTQTQTSNHPQVYSLTTGVKSLPFRRLSQLPPEQPRDAVVAAPAAATPVQKSDVKATAGIPKQEAEEDGVFKDLWKEKLSALDVATDNVLIVRGSPQAVAEVRQLIAQFDWPPHTVRLRIQICELREDAIHSLGLNFDDRKSALFVEQAGAAGFEALSAGDFRRNTGLELQATLDALMTDGKARILAEPVLSTVEGEEAMYTATENVPYFAGGTFDTDSNTESQTIAYQSIGIKLAFRPRLGRGNSLVVDVMPEISTIVEQNPGSNPRTIEELLPPRFLERRMRSVVTVENGEPFVLAGMITEQDRFDVDKVPVLSEIPLLGKLFRKKSKTRESSEVCIIVIPEIVRNPYAE